MVAVINGFASGQCGFFQLSSRITRAITPTNQRLLRRPLQYNLSMTTPILTTKFYIPTPRPTLVNRTRLIHQLRQGVQRKLTLVSAPAGFGKSTLISAWVQEDERSVAWLALDAEDHDPNRFWGYFIAALQTIVPNLGRGPQKLLQSSQPPPIHLLLTSLLNELTAFSTQLILVLDDYHLLDAQPIDDALSFLLDHMPPQLHLVLITREDPNLPLARLRVHGELTELRARDLRFSADEAAQFLNQMMGLNLSTEEVSALEARTEGWIAGLQLAALSIQGHHVTDNHSTTDFIHSFTGSHRFVMDYLMEEVLQQQSPEIQHFLYHTSILERLCGPLCDALLESATGSGQATLTALEEANMFLVPLDNERRWYRYHHLFAELLRQRLEQQKTETEIASYHRRAAHWYEAAEMELDAFRHAATAHDIDHAMRLVEGKGTPLHFRGALPAVQQWLQTLSPTEMDSRPELWVLYASVLTMSGQLTPEVEAKLAAAEAALAQNKRNLPTTKLDDLYGQIASIRAMLAIPVNDADTIRAQSLRALEFLAPENLPIRTSAAWTLGFAYQLKGERAAAMRAHQNAIAISEQSGNNMMLMAAATCLGQVQEGETQLERAAATYRRVLTVAGDPPWPAACEAHHGLARIHYQWNQLAAVQEHGEEGLQLSQQLPNVDTPATCLAVLAQVKLAQDDVDGAERLLSKAEQFLQERQIQHQIAEVANVRGLILLRQGAISAAQQFAQRAQLPLLQAQVHLAEQDGVAALALLEPLYQQMVAKQWRDEQLKVLVLQALAHQLSGETNHAIKHLAEALTLAEGGGFVRLFLDRGRAMFELLQIAARGGIKPTYTQSLLSAFATEAAPSDTASTTRRGNRPVATSFTSTTDHLTTTTGETLIEPLSEREIEVLQLIAQGLSNREIGNRLFIALDTVKGHNRKIFGKLQVQRRTEAVARARELGLI